VHVAIYAGGNPHGQEAKRPKDKDQTQANGEEKQTQTNARAFEPNNVCAVGCDISINVLGAQPPGFEIRHRLFACR
jgi:hypothetical protein